jgi:hypothetical protein
MKYEICCGNSSLYCIVCIICDVCSIRPIRFNEIIMFIYTLLKQIQYVRGTVQILEQLKILNSVGVSLIVIFVLYSPLPLIRHVTRYSF